MNVVILVAARWSLIARWVGVGGYTAWRCLLATTTSEYELRVGSLLGHSLSTSQGTISFPYVIGVALKYRAWLILSEP